MRPARARSAGPAPVPARSSIDVRASRASREAPDQNVLGVARPGPAIGDRVLRRALVVIARRPEVV